MRSPRPPRHVIDLSLAPRLRYKGLARLYKTEFPDLAEVYDELLTSSCLPTFVQYVIKTAAHIFLRRLYNSEQTEELRGVSEELGLSLPLLVAFNVVLDLLMGCTSGGVRTTERRGRGKFDRADTKMLHFRTLDWAMDPLRRIAVQLDFVRSGGTPLDEEVQPGRQRRRIQSPKVLASSITYVGFVGVLTGVRPGLSMSLNFRAVHEASTALDHARYYANQGLVLLGFRPSMATILRSYLTGDIEKAGTRGKSRDGEKPRGTGSSGSAEASLLDTDQYPGAKSLADVIEDLTSRPTTAAYLIFSDGDSTISIDKDLRTAKVRRSKDFLATTNHDVLSSAEESNTPAPESAPASSTSSSSASISPAPIRGEFTSLEELLEESRNRLGCLTERWEAAVRRRKRQLERDNNDVVNDDNRNEEREASLAAQASSTTTITRETLVRWVSAWDTTNESTHFAAIMDPKSGNIPWAVLYPEPIEAPDSEGDMAD